MHPYGGYQKTHGVVAYEIGPDSIDVEFTSGWIYHFSYQRPGPLRVERMKQLAEEGHGLTTFINKHVRTRYESRRHKGAESQGSRFPVSGSRLSPEP
jgi:hypothetical protein